MALESKILRRQLLGNDSTIEMNDHSERQREVKEQKEWKKKNEKEKRSEKRMPSVPDAEEKMSFFCSITEQSQWKS